MRWLVLLLVLFVPAAGAWTWPVQGPVLQTFSFDRAHPYDAGQHRGIAIGAGDGAPVLAPAAGVVSFAGTVPTNGKTLTIQTPSGLAVSLTHLGSIVVARDASIEEGVVVGTVGPSGTAEFDVPYVHLGIRASADEQGYLDPLAFLPVLAPPAAPPAPAPTPAPTPAPQAAPAPVAAPVAPAPVVAPSVAPPAPVAPPELAAPVVAPAAVPAPVAPPVEAPLTPPLDVPQPGAAPDPRGAGPSVEPAPAQPPVADAPAAAPSRLPEPSIGAGTPAAVAAPAVSVAVPVRFTANPAPLPLLPVRRPTMRGTQTGDAARATAAPAVWLPHGLASAPSSPRAVVSPALPAPPASGRVGATAAHTRHLPAFLVLLALAGAVASLLAVRMISSPPARNEGARPGREDPHRARLAVRERPAPYRPRRRLRGARGRVRPLSPAEGLRRPDGERDGRARHAGHGLRRPGRRVAA